MITICFTYFRSLALINLEAALFSVQAQDLSNVEKIIVVDNNTYDSVEEIQAVIDLQQFSVPVELLSFKHGDPTRTHSWSTNVAVRAAQTPWVLFTRADYILDFTLIQRFQEIVHTKEYDLHGVWRGFITSNAYHLYVDIGVCEQTPWRLDPRILRDLSGKEEDYTIVDTGVWMSRRDSFNDVDGLNERLSAWGHAQTHFQWKLFQSGVEFVRIPEPLFFHPRHSAEREIEVAHEQLREQGIDLKKMWSRYHGVSPY